MAHYPYKSTKIDYFQVGAHIGNSENDPIYFKEMENKNIILVEPVPFLYDILKHNYKERIRTNEIEFLKIAISDKDGEIEMTIPSKDNDFISHPFFLNQMASITDKYIKRFNFKERYPNFKYENLVVPCRRLNTIIKERGITDIEHLITDTEGHDYTILMDLDLNIVKPKRITFENYYMDDDGTKTNYDKLIKHYINNGYKVVSENSEDSIIELI